MMQCKFHLINRTVFLTYEILKQKKMLSTWCFAKHCYRHLCSSPMHSEEMWQWQQQQ